MPFKFLQCTFYHQTLVCKNFPGLPISKDTLPSNPSLNKIAARTDLAGHVTKFIKESFPGWVLHAVTPLEPASEIINLWIIREEKIEEGVKVAAIGVRIKPEKGEVMDDESDDEEGLAASGYVVVYDK